MKKVELEKENELLRVKIEELEEEIEDNEYEISKLEDEISDLEDSSCDNSENIFEEKINEVYMESIGQSHTMMPLCIRGGKDIFLYVK